MIIVLYVCIFSNTILQWALPHELYRKYEQAGIQEFLHRAHTAYACNGPYIQDWMAGAASWHPSVIAHRMRGAQFAYFWLQGWKDALKHLASVLPSRNVEAAYKDVETKLNAFYHPLTAPSIASPFPDNATCHTDYEPRVQRESSLKDKVISGLETNDTKGWKFIIYEEIADKGIVINARKRGYLDYKYLLYGNSESGPLSISFKTERAGKVSLYSI